MSCAIDVLNQTGERQRYLHLFFRQCDCLMRPHCPHFASSPDGVRAATQCALHRTIYIERERYTLIQMSNSRKTHIQSTCTNITVMHIQRLAHTCSHQCLLIQMCTPVSVGSTLAIACLLVPADFHSLLQQCTIDLCSTTRLSLGRQEM
jgi:hypothetical protein